MLRKLGCFKLRKPQINVLNKIALTKYEPVGVAVWLSKIT